MSHPPSQSSSSSSTSQGNTPPQGPVVSVSPPPPLSTPTRPPRISPDGGTSSVMRELEIKAGIVEEERNDEGPKVTWFNGVKPQRWNDNVDMAILQKLYPTSSRMTVSVLAGGFSSGIVLAVRSYDQSDVREVATVVKIDSKALIQQEFTAIKRVKEILGNAAPLIIDYIDALGEPGKEKGGLKFRYGVVNAASRKPRRLLDLFEELTPQSFDSIVQVINEIFGDLLDPWYSAAKPEYFPLFQYYFDGFDQNNGKGAKFSQVWQEPEYLKRFINYVREGKGTDQALHYKRTPDFFTHSPCTEETYSLAGCDQKLTNLGYLFERADCVPWLRTIPPVRLYSSYAHGDANLQNFLHDERGNVWVVDFLYTTNKQHVLRDPCKMWACIMFVVTEIATDKQFSQAVLISKTLARARDLTLPLPDSIGVTNLHLQYIYKILLHLWGHIGRITKDRSNATQFQVGLVSECMRFFLYECRNKYSKRWALVTATLLLESVISQTRRIHDIRPDWIAVPNNLCKGKLGVTRCPGNKQYSRIKTPIPMEKTASANNLHHALSASSSSSSSGGISTSNGNTPNNNNTGGGNNNNGVSAPSTITNVGSTRPIPMSTRPTPDNSLGTPSKQGRPRLKSTEEYLDDDDQDHTTTDPATAAARANEKEDRVRQQQKLLQQQLNNNNNNNNGNNGKQSSSNSASLPSSTSPSSTSSTSSSSSSSSVPSKSSPASQSSSLPLVPSSIPPSFTSANSTDKNITDGKGLPPAMNGLLPSSSSTSSTSSSSSSSSSPPPSPVIDERKRPSKLERELLKMKEVGVTHVLFSVHDSEFAEMGLTRAQVHAAVDAIGLHQTSVAIPPGEIRMTHAIQVVKPAIRVLCERPENKLVIVTKSGKHRGGVLAACILCAFGCSPKDAINLVRASRGTSAISRGREQVIAKFDLAWKNNFIQQIISSSDDHDRNVLPGHMISPSSNPSSSSSSSSTSGSSYIISSFTRSNAFTSSMSPSSTSSSLPMTGLPPLPPSSSSSSSSSSSHGPASIVSPPAIPGAIQVPPSLLTSTPTNTGGVSSPIVLLTPTSPPPTLSQVPTGANTPVNSSSSTIPSSTTATVTGGNTPSSPSVPSSSTTLPLSSPVGGGGAEESRADWTPESEIRTVARKDWQKESKAARRTLDEQAVKGLVSNINPPPSSSSSSPSSSSSSSTSVSSSATVPSSTPPPTTAKIS